jgi:5-methylcytosine-specific restriction endonuclease McrA
MSELLRRYETVGPDGYPYAWHHSTAYGNYPAGHSLANPPIKDYVRGLAGHRCERCGHPYVKGAHPLDENGESWTPCDEHCTHGGPVRRENFDGGFGPPEALWRILTVHHLDEDKANCRWWNLVALCQRCHLRMQRAVVMGRPYHYEHSEWFKPYAAGFYAWKYEKCTRCGGSGQEPFDDHSDASQNRYVPVTCDRCDGDGRNVLSREETMARLDELLEHELRFRQEALF